MKRLLLILMTLASVAMNNILGGDLRVIYPYEGRSSSIIDRDEILYIEAKYPPPDGEIKYTDLEHPPSDLGPQLADIHFKNGMILHVSVPSMEDLARYLK